MFALILVDDTTRNPCLLKVKSNPYQFDMSKHIGDHEKLEDIKDNDWVVEVDVWEPLNNNSD